jgi:phage regulator Rha-like protein
MNNLQVIPGFEFRQLVSAAEGEPVTVTFQIPKAFGKRQQHVIRALENLHCSPDFTKAPRRSTFWLSRNKWVSNVSITAGIQ